MAELLGGLFVFLLGGVAAFFIMMQDKEKEKNEKESAKRHEPYKDNLTQIKRDRRKHSSNPFSEFLRKHDDSR